MPVMFILVKIMLVFGRWMKPVNGGILVLVLELQSLIIIIIIVELQQEQLGLVEQVE